MILVKRNNGRRSRKSLLAYGLIPLLSAVSPLIALPAITDRYGGAAWVGIAVGQSLGAAAATVIELGWGLNGPQRVARMSSWAAHTSLVLSMRTKVMALLPFALIAACVAYAVAPSFRWEAALVAFGASATALSAAWWYLGRSRPVALVAADSVPRMLGMVVAGVLIAAGGPLWLYAVVGLILPTAFASGIALLISSRDSGRRATHFRTRLLVRVIRHQAQALTARVASAGYIALPIALVSIASPNSVAVFAAGERLMRMGLSAMSIIPNAMQGWVGRPSNGAERWVRAKRAVVVNLGIGVVAGVLFGVLAPPVSSVVFSGTATIPSSLAWIFSIVVVVVTVSRATGGLALVSLRRIGAYAASAVAGAVVGVPAILGLAVVLGAPGGALGEVAAETVVLCTQVIAILRHRRNSSPDEV